jgi:hypothetical protein
MSLHQSNKSFAATTPPTTSRLGDITSEIYQVWTVLTR